MKYCRNPSASGALDTFTLRSCGGQVNLVQEQRTSGFEVSRKGLPGSLTTISIMIIAIIMLMPTVVAALFLLVVLE